MKYGFVILHYLTADDTIACVESIISKSYNSKYNIVIVDNFSNNGSIEKVEKKFKNINNIHIIRNKKNLGFARGNNVGYKYCRDVLMCNCILISNNDIIVDSEELFNRIEDNINKYDCAVIGPDIISLIDNGHQNPMSDNIQSQIDISKDIIKYNILYILNFFNIYDLIKKVFKRKKAIYEIPEFINSTMLNVQLHGSFLIFTQKFIDVMEDAFCNETFLYMEETILKKICDRKNLMMIYDPRIKVYHKEDSSTNKLNNSTRKKRKFVFKNLIKSLYVLKKELRKENINEK